MSALKYPTVLVRNPNFSYPAYPKTDFGLGVEGNLYIDEAGLVFRPFGNRLRPLSIPWDNLVSTYATIGPYPNILVLLVWFLTLGAPVAVGTLGQVVPLTGVLSIKFKDAEFDKVCVVEFCHIEVVRYFAQQWSLKLDAEIWARKRALRGNRLAS